MRTNETNKEDAQSIALSALAWTLGDDARAERLLALTGIDPQDMRMRLDDPALLDAVLGFLENHEPDLIACAAALTMNPAELIAARERLNA